MGRRERCRVVRGVSKRVVEIVGQKEDCFERAIVIVRGEADGLGAAQLRQRATGALSGLVSYRRTALWRDWLLVGLRYLGAFLAGAGACYWLIH
ncbi:hypothetical protein HMPREF0262_02859 [Clostridium sp. ATCC 29733]|nr:hypothetical protein HMPREF0262_02859 [Clostridium sp. ATCC 29733]